ncbi:hypothetical protein [Micromonospora zhanjiangensis]
MSGVLVPWPGDDPTNVPPFSSAPRTAGVVAALALAATVLAGCSGEGASTDCGLDACKVTFDRNLDASASVLGVDAKLVGADANGVTVEVAGEQLTLSVDQPDAQAAGLYVSLDSLDDSKAVVRIGRNPRS